MTISEIERRLAAEFPGKSVMISINVFSIAQSTIGIHCQRAHVTGCRSIANAIEALKEKLAPANVGNVEIEA